MMIVVKYIFAVLVTLPMAVIGFTLLGNLVTSTLSTKSKPAGRTNAQGFTIQMPGTNDVSEDSSRQDF
ncbi:MAG: hypothetical protein IJH91_06890 [Mogibacterium sp.]|nr:hypothetical protein [Mogibacterium sp.]